VKTIGDLLSQFDSDLPLERAHTIPASWYFDARLADRERQTVFSGWQPVARLDQLSEPGSYVTADVAGEPIVVLRDEAGILRAFHNVCRHRAAILLTEPCGTASKIRCRYHGWTYDLAGRLRGAPEFDGVCDFERDANGLVPLGMNTSLNMVWVCADQTPSTLDTLLSPLRERTTEQVSTLHWVARREYELDCNWKVYVDNYLDGGYHVNTVHPELAGVLDYAQYRTELFENSCVQLSPLVCDEKLGTVRAGTTAEYWWVFPNFMLNLYDGVMDTNWVLPLGPERCRVIFDFYFAEESADFIRDSIDVAERVQHEDMQICAQVQRGLRSRSFNTGRYSVRREAGVHLFHRLLAYRLRTNSACGKTGH
jgi:choline monooxygenase